MHIILFINRCTPVEVLHKILLGVSKYMLISFMEHRTAAEKREILAKVATFPYCGFTGRMTGITTNLSLGGTIRPGQKWHLL